MGHFGPENVTSSQFWIVFKSLFKFCTMKEANRYMKIILMAFPKKFLFGTNGLCRTQNGSSSQLWIRCKDCWTVLCYKRGQGKHRNYVNGFSGKEILFGEIWSLSQATVYYWILKQSGHDFSVNVYVVDIIWILCEVYMSRSIFKKG